jgi:hypothetical protein
MPNMTRGDLVAEIRPFLVTGAGESALTTVLVTVSLAVLWPVLS